MWEVVGGIAAIIAIIGAIKGIYDWFSRKNKKNHPLREMDISHVKTLWTYTGTNDEVSTKPVTLFMGWFILEYMLPEREVEKYTNLTVNLKTKDADTLFLLLHKKDKGNYYTTVTTDCMFIAKVIERKASKKNLYKYKIEIIDPSGKKFTKKTPFLFRGYDGFLKEISEKLPVIFLSEVEKNFNVDFNIPITKTIRKATNGL